MLTLIIQQSIQTMSLAQFIRSKTCPQESPVYHVKQLTPERWKQFMLEVLQKMQENPKNEKNKNLITDLITIVSAISKTYFIQSALQIQPFKPQFVENNYIESDGSSSTSSTVAETIAKAAKFKIPTINMKKKSMKTEDVIERKRITQKTLQNQLNKPYHPYSYIIKNFGHLLQLKYKSVIEKKKLNVNETIKYLKKDMEVFYQFIKLSSTPYRKLFKLDINETEQVSANKMNRFIDNYVFQNTKINNSLHKIVSFSTKTQYSQMINKKIVNFDEPDNYQIPPDFKIDGCYLYSMNSLMQFSQLSHDHQKAMKKLLQFRNNILKDINEYYVNQTGSTKQLQLNAEVQIEIIRFILGKLKSWACQIFTELKFLQLIYGDQQIAYKYESISFMYTQLILAFQILQVN